MLTKNLYTLVNFGIKKPKPDNYCTKHLMCAYDGNEHICLSLFSHSETTHARTLAQTRLFANRQNCNTTENDLLCVNKSNDLATLQHTHSTIHTHDDAHSGIRAFWLDAVYQFWLCVALSIGSNDTCSPISITFIINVYLFDCISNVRFKRFYLFLVYTVCMFIFHAIFCFECVFFLDFFLQFFFRYFFLFSLRLVFMSCFECGKVLLN